MSAPFEFGCGPAPKSASPKKKPVAIMAPDASDATAEHAPMESPPAVLLQTWPRDASSLTKYIAGPAGSPSGPPPKSTESNQDSPQRSTLPALSAATLELSL